MKFAPKQRIPRDFIVLDTETTGLNCGLGQKNPDGSVTHSGEIIQLSAIAIDGASLEVGSAGRFNALIKPKNPEFASPGAIAVVGKEHFEDACANGLDAKTVYQEFVAWCKKVPANKHVAYRPWFAAFNAPFDEGMIEWALDHYGVVSLGNREKYPWHAPFCVLNLAYTLFESDPSIINFKLDTILQKVGLTRSTDVHGAEEDAELTAQLLCRILKFFRRCRAKMTIQT